MARNNWILPAVVAGGALYYYDQNVDPIISSRFKQDKIAVEQKARQAQADAKKFPAQARDAKDSAVDKAKPYVEDIQKTIEQQYNKLESKTSELSDRFKSNFNQAESDVKSLAQDNRNFVHRNVADYLDWVNHVGEKGVGAISETKAEARKVEQKAEDTKNSWWPWARETAQQQKAKAIKQYEQAKSSVEELTEKAKARTGFTKVDEDHLEKAKTEFNNAFTNLKKFGEVTYDEQKAYAESHYKEAKKTFDDLAQSVKNKATLTQQERDHYESAKKDFNNAFTSLKNYGNDVIAKVDKDYYQPLKDKTVGK